MNSGTRLGSTTQLAFDPPLVAHQVVQFRGERVEHIIERQDAEQLPELPQAKARQVASVMLRIPRRDCAVRFAPYVRLRCCPHTLRMAAPPPPSTIAVVFLGSNEVPTMSIDRIVFAFAGAMTLLSLVLAHYASPYWLLLAAFVGLNLLQAAFTGFCPLASLLRRLGVRPGAAFH